MKKPLIPSKRIEMLCLDGPLAGKTVIVSDNRRTATVQLRGETGFYASVSNESSDRPQARWYAVSKQ